MSSSINNNIAQIIFPSGMEVRKIRKKRRKSNGSKKKAAIDELKEALKSFDLAVDEADRRKVALPQVLGHLPSNINDLNTIKEIQALTESIRNRIVQIQQMVAESVNTNRANDLFGEDIHAFEEPIPQGGMFPTKDPDPSPSGAEARLDRMAQELQGELAREGKAPPPQTTQRHGRLEERDRLRGEHLIRDSDFSPRPPPGTPSSIRSPRPPPSQSPPHYGDITPVTGRIQSSLQRLRLYVQGQLGGGFNVSKQDDLRVLGMDEREIQRIKNISGAGAGQAKKDNVAAWLTRYAERNPNVSTVDRMPRPPNTPRPPTTPVTPIRPIRSVNPLYGEIRGDGNDPDAPIF